MGTFAPELALVWGIPAEQLDVIGTATGTPHQGFLKTFR